MNATVTDEMVVAARKAFVGKWDGVVMFDTAGIDTDMRAALEAALPLIRTAAIEECANHLERIGPSQDDCYSDYTAGFVSGFEDASAAIRSLARNTP